MDLDPQRCLRALASRDARFDGRFFFAVRTTGVYCRPVCPAPTPRPRNVELFGCPAAAESAGYRPCRRCRPQAAPGLAVGTSATVAAALRRIEAGEADGGPSLDDLARGLGVGPRHLRRLFVGHLGATPAEVVRSRRVAFARRLIEETDLPMTRVAHAAGFGSVRRFNDAIRSACGATPTELRRGGRRPAGPGFALELAYRPPWDGPGTLDFLAARATPGVEVVDAAGYRRTVAVDGAVGVLAVGPVEGRAALRLTVGLDACRPLLPLVERVRRLFDLGADPLAIGDHLGTDPALAGRLAARPGIRVPGAWEPFEAAVRVVLGQQISVAAATTLAGRVAARWGRPVDVASPGLTHLGPRPEDLAEADLESIGLPRARAGAVRALAGAVAGGRLPLDGSLPADEVAARLLALPGIGPWTADMIALRVLDDPDAFPAGDLGLRRALGLDDPAALLVRAEPWRPWRAYAARLLWTERV